MRWTNYHGHSKYCDGHGEIEDYILKAIELDMASIGISSHAPVPFDTVWTMPQDKINSYLEDIDLVKNKYGNQINIYKSLEIDYIPDIMSPKHPNILNYDLDYTIGSIHFVDKDEHDVYWEIDGPEHEFGKGYESVFHREGKSAAIKFFQLQNEMLENHTPDILGHMDKIKMHNKAFKMFNEQDEWYVNEVKQSLMLAKEKDSVVEINTKAFNRTGLLYPGPEYFRFIKDNQIPITINSDAHMTKFLTLGFEEVAEMLIDCGVTTNHEFIDGEWVPVELTLNGLAL